MTADCRDFTPPRDVAALDELSRTYLGHPAFQGGDAAIDAVLSDGRRLVVFGDTLRTPDYPGGAIVRNSIVIVESMSACVILGPGGSAAIPDRRDGVGYWPMSIVVDPESGLDEVVVMMQRVTAARADDLGFAILGTSYVRLLLPPGEAPVLADVIDMHPDDRSMSQTTWGAAMWQDADGWIYVYGTRSPEEVGIFGRSLMVARSRWGTLDDMSQWEYWDGAQWVTRPADAAVLIAAEQGVAQVLSVFETEGRWRAVSTLGGDLGDEVVVWDAPTPTGPFIANPPSLRLPPDSVDGALTYLVLAHPSVFPEEGSVVISYSQGVTEAEDLLDEPLRYRPRFVRIDLPS